MSINTSDKITTTQAAIAVSSVIIGAGIITITRTASRTVGTPDIWITTLIGGLVALSMAIIAAKLSRRFPGKVFYEYSGIIAGKPIGWLLSLFLTVFFLVLAGFEVRILYELVATFLLERTPIEVVIIAFLCAGTYLIAGGINPMVRIFELYFPPAIIIFLIIFLLGFQRFELDNLRPVLGQGVTPVLKGIPTTFLFYTGFEIMLVITAFMEEPRKAVKAAIIGMVTPTIIYVLASVVVIGVLTVEETKTLTWPTASLINSIEYPGGFVENFQIFFLIVWILAVYTTYVGAHYMSSLGASYIFKINHSISIYAFLPVIYIIALLPQNIDAVFKFGDYIGYFGGFISALISPALLVTSIIRRKGYVGKLNEK